MNNAAEADTLAFIEVLAGEYAGAVSVRSQRPSASHDPLCERIECLIESGVLAAF